MNQCPICGFIYSAIYNVIQPSVCLCCKLDIEISHIRFIQRQQSKFIWKENMKLVHEELLPIILHPDRFEWFLPDLVSKTISNL